MFRLENNVAKQADKEQNEVTKVTHLAQIKILALHLFESILWILVWKPVSSKLSW